MKVMTTNLPTYADLLYAMKVVYDHKRARRFGLAARFTMRRSKRLAVKGFHSQSDIDSVLSLVYLFDIRTKRFHTLMRDWIYYCFNKRPDYTFGKNPYVPPSLLSFLHGSIKSSTPSEFNHHVALYLGCSPDVADAMSTKRAESPRNMPVLPLSSFHLDLPADDYAKAVDVFDIYTSRLLGRVQDDHIAKYLRPHAYSWALGKFTAAGADASTVLAWQIARAVMVNLAIDDAAELAAAGVDPVDVITHWVRGIRPELVKQMLLNDLDIDMVLSIHLSDPDAVVVDDAVTYVEWSRQGEVDEEKRRRTSVHAAMSIAQARYNKARNKASSKRIVK